MCGRLVGTRDGRQSRNRGLAGSLDGYFRQRLPTYLRAAEPWSGFLDGDVYRDARQVLQGWDVYAVQQEWWQWLGESEMESSKPEANFLKSCHSWVEKRGAALTKIVSSMASIIVDSRQYSPTAAWIQVQQLPLQSPVNAGPT